ncbi:MAG: conjugal transfer protein TrbD [Sedimenticola sp.]
MSSEIETVPIRRALVRPRLMAGAERKLFLFLGLICAAMIFVSVSWPSAAFGVFLWMSGIYVLREMAKADPMMSRVYVRHRRYQAYYPARSPLRVTEKKRRTKTCWR